VLPAGEVPAGATVFNLSDFAREAEGILERARSQAGRILDAARASAADVAEAARAEGQNRGMARGLEEGRAQGLEEGRGEGLAACQQATATLAEALEKLLGDFGARRAALLKEAEHDLLQLSVRIAERVVRARLEVDRDAAVRAVAEAIGLASERSRVRVRLSPVDLQALKDARGELERRFAEMRDLELIADGEIASGGCRVSTAAGEVDMRVDTQLERIASLLVGASGEQEGTGR
jgi:flagellar assembly protein FliH